MSESSAPAAQAPKKSFFKRPTWAAPATQANGTDTSSTNLFDRSGDFTGLVADKGRQRQDKSPKKKAKEERRRSSGTHYTEDTPERKASSKRRRISELDDGLAEPLENPSHRDERPTSIKDGESTSQKQNHVPAATKTTPQMRSRRNKATVIEIESDADEDSDASLPQSTESYKAVPEPQATEAYPDTTQPPQSDSESDPELAELKRKARQKRRLELEKDAKQPSGDGSGYRYLSPAPDPIIQIFVTSPIPNTTPLIVTRKLSQRLQEVREAWITRQHFPPDFLTSNVFFTYRLSKVYDVTACKSLGIRVDSEGRIIPDNKSWNDEDETGEGGQYEGKVHLEAMTEEIYSEMRNAKRNARPGSFLAFKPSPAGADTEGTPMEGGEQDANKEVLIRITLKAKGFKDAKLKVKPSTAFSRIANAARQLFGKQKPIPDDQTLTLVFDGEPLEPPDGLIRDTEIEDKDGIEVYFK